MKRLIPLAPIALLFILMGCFDTQSPVEQGKNDSGIHSNLSGEPEPVSLSENDPYTTQNMQKVLDSLIEHRKSKGPLSKGALTALEKNFQLSSNYIYVKFIAETDSQAAFIKEMDPDIVVFDKPMDQDVDTMDKPYKDPSLSESQIALFAAVPVDYKAPNEIQMTIVKELFLIEPILNSVESKYGDGEGTMLAKSSAEIAQHMRPENAGLMEILDALGYDLQQFYAVSLYLAGQLNSKSTFGKGLTKSSVNTLSEAVAWGIPSRWRPSGTLKYHDGTLGRAIPVEGVRVTAGYSYYWRSSTTNGNGYFESPERWTYSVKYNAHWDAADFKLEQANWFWSADAKTEGPTQKSAWNRTFTGHDALYAVIFRAAYFYYYGTHDATQKPRRDTWYQPRLDIAVWFEDNGKGNPVGHFVSGQSWLGDQIEVYTVYNGKYMDFDYIFGITIHELAHSANFENFHTRHWAASRSAEFSIMHSNVKESFAMGLEWSLTRKIYPNFQPVYGKNYTGIIQDLMDNDNFSGWYFADNRPKERISEMVTGYTLGQIEEAVMRSFYWSEFRNEMKNRYPSNATKGGLDALFSYWE